MSAAKAEELAAKEELSKSRKAIKKVELDKAEAERQLKAAIAKAKKDAECLCVAM